MRQHYHIWLIGAACALAVLATSSIVSLINAQPLNQIQATSTAVQIELAPHADLVPTAIEPVAEPATEQPHKTPGHAPAAPPQLLAVPGPDGQTGPFATPAEIR